MNILDVGTDLRRLNELNDNGEVNHTWAFLAFIGVIALVAYWYFKAKNN